MNRIFILSTLIFFLPTLALANDYYWRIGQCQPGVKSEACDGRIISLSLTDATQYGELKLINLPSSISEAMTLSSCNIILDTLVRRLNHYDTQNPYTSYNTDISMVRKKNEERFGIVLKSESEINSCVVNHPKLLEEEDRKKAEEEAKVERIGKIEEAIKSCNLMFFEQMTSSEKMTHNNAISMCRESVNQQKELELQGVAKEAEKRQREIDEAVAKALAEQAAQQAQTAPKPAPVASPKPTTAPTSPATSAEPEKQIDPVETTSEESIPEEQAAQIEEFIEPLKTVEDAPEPKPTFFKRIKSFFSRWF